MSLPARRARRPVDRRRRPQPAVPRRPPLPRPTGSTRCSSSPASRPRPRSTSPPATKVALAVAAIVAAPRSASPTPPRCTCDGGPRPSSPRSSPTPGTTTSRSPPSSAGPAGPASRASPPSTARSSTAPSTASARSSAKAASQLRVAQTGYVRNYALGVAVGAVVLVGLFLGRRVLMEHVDRLASTSSRRSSPCPRSAPLLVALVSRRRPELSPPARRCSFTLATGALAVWLLLDFETARRRASSSPTTYTWIESLGIGWRVGVDGISLFLVVLTGVLFPIALLGADPHHDHKPYYAWLLLLEAGCLGVFLSPRPLPCSS